MYKDNMMISKIIFGFCCLYATVCLAKARTVPNHLLWKPENGSMEEWYQCHGLPCDEYYEVQRKMKELMKQSIVVEPKEDSSLDNPLVSGTLDGCIWLTPDQIDWMLKDTEKTAVPKEGSTRQKRKALNFDTLPSFKWPENRPIIYKFDGKHDQSQRELIRSGLAQIEENTCIRFQEVPTDQDVRESHIMVTREASGCHSYVGKTYHYPQQLNLQDVCLGEFGIIIHEFLHALGMWHEQMRFDRDGYIKILYENLGFYQGQYRRVDDTVSLGVPYDYGSVMHYSPRDGSANGRTVIESLDPLYQSSMGQRSGLSFFDAKIINAAYCSNVCRWPTQRPCQRGGYQDPNNCDRCKCPDGFSGPYCEEVAPPKQASCGGEIQLRENEVQIVSSPGYGNAPYRDFIECSWLIKAPRNQKVELQFEDRFGVFCHNQRECYHWVEVKYKNDKGMYGPRFCCYAPPKVMLRSEDEEMAIIFRTNFTVTSSHLLDINIGFKASVRAVADSGPYTQMPSTESTTMKTTTTTQTTTTTTTPRPSGSRLVWGCNFEGKDGFSDLCDMSQDRRDVFDWTVQSGRTPSDETGPERAYSGKYYIFIEASNPRRNGDRAVIRLPQLNARGQHCLRWRYHMYGFHINTLQVFVERQQQSIIWSQNIPFEDQTMNWLEGYVDLDLPSESRLGFTGITGDEFSGDIALDDISLRTGPC